MEGSDPMAKKNNIKREDGRYAVQVYIGIVDGKRKYKTAYGKTQKEADAKAEELRVSLRKGIDISSSNDLFKTWVEYWLTSKKYEVSEDRYTTLLSRSNIWMGYLKNTPIIRGINGTELVELILKYYDGLSDKYRQMIPLQKVYIPNLKSEK